MQVGIWCRFWFWCWCWCLILALVHTIHVRMAQSRRVVVLLSECTACRAMTGLVAKGYWVIGCKLLSKIVEMQLS